jgi:hypothetical protein
LDLPGFLVERHQAATQFFDHVVGTGRGNSCGGEFSIADGDVAFDAILLLLSGGDGWPDGLAGGIASFNQGDQPVESSTHQLAFLTECLLSLGIYAMSASV